MSIVSIVSSRDPGVLCVAPLLLASVVVGRGLEYVGLSVGQHPGVRVRVEGGGVGAERERGVALGAQRHGGGVRVERVVRVRVRERGGVGVREGGGVFAHGAVAAVAGEGQLGRARGRVAEQRVLVVRYQVSQLGHLEIVLTIKWLKKHFFNIKM